MIELIGLIFLIIATIYDIKGRYIPDYVNYTFISIASYFFIQSPHSIYHLLFISFVILISYILYKTGSWGGGDLKLIVALSLLLNFKFMISFLLNIAVLSPLYILPLTFFVGLRKLKPSKKEAILILVGLPFLCLIFNINLFFIGLSIFILFSLPYLKKVEEKVLTRRVSPLKLMDGDWLLEEIKVCGRAIKPKKSGLTKEEVIFLRDCWRNGKLKKKVLIKEGFPFVPAMLIAYLYTIYFGPVFNILAPLVFQ